MEFCDESDQVVLVSEIPVSVSSQDVATIFQAHGKVILCQRRPTNNRGEGQIIVVYDDAKGAVNAVEARKN